jgi:hypothetical protein
MEYKRLALAEKDVIPQIRLNAYPLVGKLVSKQNRTY